MFSSIINKLFEHFSKSRIFFTLNRFRGLQWFCLKILQSTSKSSNVILTFYVFHDVCAHSNPRFVRRFISITTNEAQKMKNINFLSVSISQCLGNLLKKGIHRAEEKNNKIAHKTLVPKDKFYSASFHFFKTSLKGERGLIFLKFFFQRKYFCCLLNWDVEAFENKILHNSFHKKRKFCFGLRAIFPTIRIQM